MVESKWSIVSPRGNYVETEIHNHEIDQRLEAKELPWICQLIVWCIELNQGAETLCRAQTMKAYKYIDKVNQSNKYL